MFFSFDAYAFDYSLEATAVVANNLSGLETAFPANHYFGYGLEYVGDIDADGIGDIAVSGQGDSGNRGKVYVLFLNSDDTVREYQVIGNSLGGLTSSLDLGDSFGVQIEGLGDIDGDLVPDIAVSAMFDDGLMCQSQLPNQCNYGAVYILMLNRDGTVKMN